MGTKIGSGKGIAALVFVLLFGCSMLSYADEIVTIEALPGVSYETSKASGVYTISDSPMSISSTADPASLSAHTLSGPDSASLDYVTGPGVGLPGSSVGPVSGPGTSAPSTLGLGSRAGINHAGDASTVVELGFKLVSPKVQKGSYNVAEGSVQLSDGSWASIGHEYNLDNPYFRVLREETDSQGVEWYVVATHASKIGEYYTADGSLATELRLKKSDCNEMSSITLNTTNQTRINIVKTAFENLGDDYTYGMTGPDEFDCSGFVYYVFSQAGISVPRQSTAICQMAGQISIEDLRPGDIVGRSGHVGVYIGNGIFIHSSETITGVIAEYVDVYNSVVGFTNYINAVGD